MDVLLLDEKAIRMRAMAMEEIDQVVRYSLGGNLGDCRMVTLTSEKTRFLVLLPAFPPQQSGRVRYELESQRWKQRGSTSDRASISY